MATKFRVCYSLKTIIPFSDIIELEFGYGNSKTTMPTVKEIIDEIILRKPKLEKKRDLIKIDSHIEIKDGRSRK